MCAEKHGPPPVCSSKPNVPCAATTLLRPPHYSTSLHSQRHARDVCTNMRMFIPFLPSICRGTRFVGESGGILLGVPRSALKIEATSPARAPNNSGAPVIASGAPGNCRLKWRKTRRSGSFAVRPQTGGGKWRA
jgi:hypothetical protein